MDINKVLYSILLTLVLEGSCWDDVRYVVFDEDRIESIQTNFLGHNKPHLMVIYLFVVYYLPEVYLRVVYLHVVYYLPVVYSSFNDNLKFDFII